MGKRLIGMAAALIALVLVIPVYSEADDGGSKEYSAILYRVTLRHSMAQSDGEKGYLTGTEVRILGMEIYSDVAFVPAGEKGRQQFSHRNGRIFCAGILRVGGFHRII